MGRLVCAIAGKVGGRGRRIEDIQGGFVEMQRKSLCGRETE